MLHYFYNYFVSLLNHKMALYLIVISTVGLTFVSCDSPTEPFKPFVSKQIPVYPEKADTIIAYSGKNQVLLKIAKPVDPRVIGVYVYWNTHKDSLKKQFPKARDTLNVLINSLQGDRTYTFDVYTFNKAGDKSIGQSVAAKVYGSIYANKIANRSISNVKPIGKNSVVVAWGKAGKGAIGTVLKYTNIMEEVDSVYVPIDSSKTHIENASDQKRDSIWSYYTLYRPKASIDTFYTNQRKIDFYSFFPSANIALNKTIVAKSSDCSCGRVSNVTDGNMSTYWQPLSGDRKDGKIWFTVDLGSIRSFNKVIQYWVKGAYQFTGYKILYSDDRTTWKTAYASMSGVSSKEVATFPAVEGRYVKLIILINGTHSEGLGEFEVIGKPIF